MTKLEQPQQFVFSSSTGDRLVAPLQAHSEFASSPFPANPAIYK